MQKIIEKFEKNFDKIVNIFIVLLMVYILFYIFVGSKSSLNSDSAFVTDYAVEQIRTHSFFPKDWVNSNDFWIYALIPIITPMLKLGLSMFHARQVAVFVQTVVLFLVLYDLFKKVFNDKKGLKILLLIFLSGVSGEFIFELYGDATYESIIFYMLVCLWLFIKYVKSERVINLTFLGIILTLVTACSLRFPIYIAAPLICCILYFIYEKGFQKKYILLFIVVVISTMVGYLLFNILSNNLCLVGYTDHINPIQTSEKLRNSISNMIYNYLQISGTTDINLRTLNIIRSNNISMSQPMIILVFFRFIYALITILLPIILRKKIKEMSEIEKILYLYITSFTVLLMFFLIIGQMSIWYRYLIPMIFFLNLLYPLLYKFYFKGELKNKIVFGIIISMYVVSSIYLCTNSFYSFKKKKVIENHFQALTDFLVENDLKQGFVDDIDFQNILRLLSNNKVQVATLIDDNLPYNWLSSKYWFNKKYYTGEVFILLTKKDLDLQMPYPNDSQSSKQKYPNALRVLYFKKYVIYVFKNIDELDSYIYYNTFETNEAFMAR